MSALSESSTDQRFDGSGGPRRIGPANGRLIDIQSAGVRFMAWSEETGGGYSLVGALPPHGFVTPLHKHSREDEYSYVLEGRSARCSATTSCTQRWTIWSSSRATNGTRSGTRAIGPAQILEIISPGGSSTASIRWRRRWPRPPSTRNRWQSSPATTGSKSGPTASRSCAPRTDSPDAPGQPLTRRLAMLPGQRQGGCRGVDTTAGMVASVAPASVVRLAHRVAVRPGDVIATGTPGGVGEARGRNLLPGDVVEVDSREYRILRNAWMPQERRSRPPTARGSRGRECEVDGIGTLRNPVVAG